MTFRTTVLSTHHSWMACGKRARLFRQANEDSLDLCKTLAFNKREIRLSALRLSSPDM